MNTPACFFLHSAAAAAEEEVVLVVTAGRVGLAGVERHVGLGTLHQVYKGLDP